MNHRHPPKDQDFECVEPATGEIVWRLGDPDLPADLRERLEAHLEVCDACRLDVAITGTVTRLIVEGEVRVPPPRRGPRLAAVGGGLALAASLALIFVLPPESAVPSVPRRGVDETRIVRPVEGEVVPTDRVRLDWTPVAGATAYRVEVDAVGGDHRWSGRFVAPPARLPAEAVPGSGRYRALIEPVPQDLALPGDLSVSFRRAGPLRFLTYRLGAAPRPATILGLFGLAGLVGAALASRLRRPA